MIQISKLKRKKKFRKNKLFQMFLNDVMHISRLTKATPTFTAAPPTTTLATQ